MDARFGRWREVVALAVRHGIPTPTFGSALCYFDGYRSAWPPANLRSRSVHSSPSDRRLVIAAPVHAGEKGD